MPQKIDGKGYPYISPSDFTEHGIDYDNAKQISYESFSELSRKMLPEKEDIIFPRYGTIGKIRKIDTNRKILVSYSCCVIKPISKFVLVEYLYLVLLSPFIKKEIDRYTNKTTQPNVGLESIKSFLFPLPPISEQKRIVNKIKKLEPLIEKYKQAEEKLHELNSNIKEQLKKSILQYAIEGKLVPQDPNDEPASVLLDRIRKEKQKLIAEGKIKKDKNESIIYRRDNSYYEKFDNIETCLNDKLPYDLPTGWDWCNVGNLFANSTGLSYKKDQLNKKSNSMIRVLRGGNIQDGNYIFKKDDIFISSEFVKQDLFLKKGYMITPAVTSLEHIGKIALIDKDYDNIVVGGFVLMLKPIFQYYIMLQYLLLFFSTNYHREACRKITHKSGQAFYNLSRDKLMKLYIAIPPLGEQKRIVDKFNKITKFLDL